MMDRQAEQEFRVSRAAQEAADRAAERAHQSREQARLARIEGLEHKVQRAINSLFAVMVALWLIGLGVVIALSWVIG